MSDASLFTMRPADFSDLEVLTSIDARCFSPGIAYSREEIAWLLQARFGLTLVAERSDVIAGFASLRLVRPRRVPGQSTRGELITIDVLPEFRRAGAGWELHQRLEEWLRAAGGNAIELHVAVDNATAIRFYERLGYRILARVPRYYLGTSDAWRMEKAL